MEKKKFPAAVLSLFLLVPASITCAQAVSSQKGLTTAVFTLQEGVINVYLPGDIRPGDNISGQIIAAPAGKNASAQRRNLARLATYSVNIYNSKIPVDTLKRFSMSIPGGRPIACRVGLINAAGNVTKQLIVPSIPEHIDPTVSSGYFIPAHALTGTPLRITGPFDGDASNTRCMLDHIPMQVLAESPRLAIVSFPSTAGGMHTINNQENGRPAGSGRISGVDMTVSAGKLNLLKGEKTYIDVKITGLGNLRDTARLNLVNTTPDVITFANGNTFTISIPPAPDSTNRTYTQQFTVQSIKSGAFSANVNLDLPDSQATPVVTEAARLPILIFGRDISMTENGQCISGNENELYKIFAIDNSIYIFSKNTFIKEYTVPVSGPLSVQDKLAAFADNTYPAPGISCDSLTRICRKHAALNVFWGDIYSVFEGKEESRTVNGEIFSKHKDNSLLFTRGWEINCCTGEFQLKLLFEALQAGSDNKESRLTFSKILKNGQPCPLSCPECKANCDEVNKQIEAQGRLRNKKE